MKLHRSTYFATLATIAAIFIVQGCASSTSNRADTKAEKQDVEQTSAPSETEAASETQPAPDATPARGADDLEQPSAAAPPPTPLPDEIAGLELPDVAKMKQDVYVTTLATPASYEQLSAAGIATVIDLHSIDREQAEQYGKKARAHNISYVRMPTSGPESLEYRRIDVFSDVIRKEIRRGGILIQAEEPTVAAAFIAAHAGLFLEQPIDEALAEGRRLGLTDEWVDAVSTLIEAGRQ